MASKYPLLKSSEVASALRKLGFSFKSQRGSHAKYVKAANGGRKRTVIVPMHDEVAKGTLQRIMEQAGITLDELVSAL